jgi:hypothetical protein
MVATTCRSDRRPIFVDPGGARFADWGILLFDLGDAILPSRPRVLAAAVSSGGQGWPPLRGHPKGLSLTAASMAAGSTVARRRSGRICHASVSQPHGRNRELHPGGPSIFPTNNNIKAPDQAHSIKLRHLSVDSHRQQHR